MTVSQYRHSADPNDRHSQLKAHIDSLADHPLKGCGTVFEQVVAWGDMDIFAHLNNVRYYEYAQSARVDNMTRAGVFGNGEYTVIVSTSCQYKHSVYFPDTLWIGVKVKKIGNTSLTHEYLFFSTAQQKIVATGESVVVNMNANGEKTPFSDEKRAILANF